MEHDGFEVSQSFLSKQSQNSLDTIHLQMFSKLLSKTGFNFVFLPSTMQLLAHFKASVVV